LQILSCSIRSKEDFDQEGNRKNLAVKGTNNEMMSKGSGSLTKNYKLAYIIEQYVILDHTVHVVNLYVGILAKN